MPYTVLYDWTSTRRSSSAADTQHPLGTKKSEAKGMVEPSYSKIGVVARLNTHALHTIGKWKPIQAATRKKNLTN